MQQWSLGRTEFRKVRGLYSQLFKETCEIKQLPLELNEQQLRAFLFTLYNMDFSATTISCRW